ncbi:MAG TPA: hypothetical protein VFG69_08150 [Nannocystaceae bacterium]|nr:hypothetical protein [Nannocystaceae bacterium]
MLDLLAMAAAHLTGLAILALAACNVTLSPTCGVTSNVDADGLTRGAASGPEAPASAPLRCPGPRGSGTTPCFADGCGPGQMCDQSVLPECRPGCSSDEHCAPTDRCVRAEGETIGRCESCSAVGFAEAAPHCVDPARTGVTACFHTCGPGTYCRDTECVAGCVTDGNCGPTERCERPGSAKVGVCTSCFATVHEL